MDHIRFAKAISAIALFTLMVMVLISSAVHALANCNYLPTHESPTERRNAYPQFQGSFNSDSLLPLAPDVSSESVQTVSCFEVAFKAEFIFSVLLTGAWIIPLLQLWLALYCLWHSDPESKGMYQVQLILFVVFYGMAIPIKLLCPCFDYTMAYGVPVWFLHTYLPFSEFYPFLLGRRIPDYRY